MLTRKTLDLEKKLLLLFAIDQLGPLTGPQLLQFLAECELMDYFTMQLTLGDLRSAGHIGHTQSALGPQYALTAMGRESLALFLNRLPHSLKTLVRDAVPTWRPRFQREAQILSDFSRLEDGRYALRLRLMEADDPLLDMTLFLPSRDMADRLARRWPAAAAEFYGLLMKELGESFSQSAGESGRLPPGARLDGAGPRGCLLHLEREGPKAPALSLSLDLPTYSMALSFAQNWPAKADDLCAFLMDSLAREA